MSELDTVKNLLYTAFHPWAYGSKSKFATETLVEMISNLSPDTKEVISESCNYVIKYIDDADAVENAKLILLNLW